jgi:hypothetical protein
MRLKVLFVLFNIFYQVSSKKVSLVLDDTLINFRDEILTFQSDSMITLDKVFFVFYDELYTSMNDSALHPYIKLIENFNKSCSEFPMFTLQDYAARRLVNICDEVQRLYRRVQKLVEEIIKKYFSEHETLTTETLLEIIAEEYFEGMNRHLDFVVPIHNQNKKCVVKLFDTFFKIYKKPISIMEQTMKTLNKKMQRAVNRDLRFISDGISKLFGVTNRMANCSNDNVIDTFGCISGFVNFDCRKWKTGCGPVYKSIFITISHFKKIDNYFVQYDKSFEKIYEALKRADISMLLWTDELDKCIVIEE